MSTVLGFDYGSKRIGVAIGNHLLGTARPLAVVDRNRDGDEYERIEKLIAEHGANELVVGLPLTMDGKEQPMSAAARDFAVALARRFALPVALHDERLSSAAASASFREHRAAGLKRRRDQQRLDAYAAAHIVESYLGAR